MKQPEYILDDILGISQYELFLTAAIPDEPFGSFIEDVPADGSGFGGLNLADAAVGRDCHGSVVDRSECIGDFDYFIFELDLCDFCYLVAVGGGEVVSDL